MFFPNRRQIKVERTQLPKELRPVVVPDVAVPELGSLRREARPVQQSRPLRNVAEADDEST